MFIAHACLEFFMCSRETIDIPTAIMDSAPMALFKNKKIGDILIFIGMAVNVVVIGLILYYFVI